ncbi:PPE family protein [Mycobacterium sp. Marseille-P9652]|uniref:PPE family protein n=1 Tax=Mycobacterium sp. Marseille-P9652 TaxID=2654950 RepID=UPI0012E903A1|nr:PPE family protein [Mycobacterium sp. Marseille-P9652]
MDFGMLSPEVNSGRMYAGPGSSSLLAAAQAWAQLADELYAAAGGYQLAVTELTAGPWSGPAAAAMTAAALPYAEWLGGTAALAEETAARATSAVAAYEAAFAATVPPVAVAANRSLLAALVATNFFGQNTPAIAATEAQYAEMWAQDAAAMYAYAASSAASTALTPPRPPVQNTDPGGPAAQAAAVSRAAGAPAGAVQSGVSVVPQAFSAVPAALQGLATAAPAAQATDPLGPLTDLITIFVSAPSGLATLGVLFPESILDGAVDTPFAIAGALLSFHTDAIVSGWDGTQIWPGTDPAPVLDFPATLTNLSPGTVPAAGLGGVNTVGALSVPPAWTAAVAEVRPAAMAIPLADGLAAAPEGFASSAALSDMGLAAMTGRAMAGPVNGGGDGVRVTGRRVTTGFAEPAADAEPDATHPEPRVVVTGVAARIREIALLRDEGKLADDEYQQLKNQLLGR